MRVVHEDDRCYRMSDGTVIAKAGLSDGTRRRIRGYAQGGVVQSTPESLSPEDRAIAEQAALDALDAQAASQPDVAAENVAAIEALAGGVPEPAPVVVEQMDLGRPVPPSLPGRPESGRDWLVELGVAKPIPGGFQPTGKGVRDLLVDAGIAQPAPEGMAPGRENAPLTNQQPYGGQGLFGPWNQGPATGSPASPSFTQGAEPIQSIPQPEPVVAPEPLVAAPPPVAAQPRPAAPRPEAPPQVDPALAHGLRAQVVAAEGAAAVEKARLANAAQMELDAAAALEARRRQYETEHAENQRRAEALANEVAAGRLDPNRLWNRLDTGQRMGNAISLILGGIGSALVGGPNQALQVIEGAIDRDIESQKDERSRKQGLVQFHLDKGRDLTSAYELAKADMLTIAAGRMRGMANRYGAMATSAAALDAAGKLETKGVELRAKALEADMDGKFKRAQIDNLRAQSAQHWAQAKATKGAEAAQGVESAYLSGRPTPVAQRAALSKDAREAGVEIAGALYAAHDRQSAEEARKALSAAAGLQSAIGKMRAFRAEKGRAWVPGSGESAEANALRGFAQLAVKAGANLGALDEGSKEFLNGIVSNPGGVWTTDATVEANLDALDAWAESTKAATLGAALVAPPQARGQKIRPGG